MPSEHDVRQRAVICQDCWFWKEMSCALSSPENGVCANRRPVHGREPSARPKAPAQAPLVPLQPWHAAVAGPGAPRRLAPVAAVEPFSEDAPESTFSLAKLASGTPAVGPSARLRDAAPEQPVRAMLPSFREIRSGRAAAAMRTPAAEVRIAVADVTGPAASPPLEAAQAVLPGMDALVERVRQRTAARLSQSGAAVRV